MKTFSTFALIAGLLSLAVSSQARPPIELHTATLSLKAAGTNDAGQVKAVPFPGKFLVELTSEGTGFQTRGLALAFDHSVNELVVINTTNQNIETLYFYFAQQGDAVTSANGTQQQRLMNVHSSDNTVVGTAVFVERFAFNDAQEETSYSLQATLQINLPISDTTTLGADRPTIMTGRLTIGKKLSPVH
jgi:hypothetical protein